MRGAKLDTETIPSRGRTARAVSSGFLEICTDSLAGARIAVAGGADQIELCAALALGGLTPSQGLMESVLAIAAPAGVPVRAMVRPRPGDFAYDADALVIAVRDAKALIAAGAAGLVFGVARAGRIDWAAMQRWRDDARVNHVTLHRAIDTSADPLHDVERAIAAGIDQILTSGGRSRAIDALPLLTAMTAAADGRCRIVAGAGVDPENAPVFVAAGIRALHATARKRVVGDALPPVDPLGFGTEWPLPAMSVITRLRRALDGDNV